jgi:hypothetical protein
LSKLSLCSLALALAILPATTPFAAAQLAAASPSPAQPHDHPSKEVLGTVNFQTSCAPAVQPQFNRAVALMHSFQFGPAIAGFHAVLAADPSCAIAYWGIALSNWSNPFAAAAKPPAALDAGLKAVEQGRAAQPKTGRERAYMQAVAHLYTDSTHIPQHARQIAYEEAMASVSAANPADTEAAIFYALALAAAADPSDKTYAKQLQAGAILDRLFAQYPDHPGLAHYIIHTYDTPALAARASVAAQRYSAIAPSTAHALHMPSHTFTRLGDWKASIDTNLASAASAHKASQPADELHASDYLVYAYLQTAQDNAAANIVQSSAQVFAHYDPSIALNGAAGPAAAYFARAAIPARYALERHAWSEAAKLEPLPSSYPYTDAITWFARGLGAAHMRDPAATQTAIDALTRLHQQLAAANEPYWANQVDIQRQEVTAWLSFATGASDQAVSQMRAAAEAEDKTEKNVVTPGPLAPARELLGDLLLELHQPAEALHEYQATLVHEPNRFWSLYGAAKAAAATGDREHAHEYAAKLQTIATPTETPTRPELAELAKLAAPK